MLLFRNDWERYPTAIVDMQTSNKSFIRMSGLLKAMGVENHLFMLTLLQPELQGVDPYDPNLSDEIKAKIIIECNHNFFFFLREVVKISSGGVFTQFRLNRGILSYFWSLLATVDYSLIMCRQSGKSFGADVLSVWLLYCKLENAKMFLFTKDGELRKTNIKRIKEIRDTLPKYLIPLTKADSDNVESVTCITRGNELKTAVGQSNKARALNIGRGETLFYSQTDEGPFIANADISIPVLMIATSAAREIAEENGLPYGNSFTSTAGMLNTSSGAFMHSLITSGATWDERFYDAVDKYELKEMISTNSSTGRVLINGTFSHRQLGYTDEWLNKRILDSGDTKMKIDMEFYNIWQSGTVGHPLPQVLLSVVTNSVIPSLYTSISVDMYMIKWYIEESEIAAFMTDNSVVIGLDTSDAIGRDANGLVFSSIKDMRVIGTSKVSSANLHSYAIWISEILIRYPKTVLVIENKSSAQGIIDTVVTKLTALGIDPFTRMYNKVVDNYLERPNDYKEICTPMNRRFESTFLKFKKDIGIKTTGTTRAHLYDTVFMEACKSIGHLVSDESLINEIKSLVVKNGRVDHDTDGHDDLVISWLLTHWFIKHTKNLQHYGIKPNEALILVNENGAMLTDEEMENQRLLIVLRLEIQEIKERLLSGVGIVEATRLERTLTARVNECMALGDSAISIDSIMNDVSSKRTTKRSLVESIARFQRNRR